MFLTHLRRASTLTGLIAAAAMAQPYWDWAAQNVGPAAVATASDGKLYFMGSATASHLGMNNNCMATTKVTRFNPIAYALETTGISQLNTARCNASAITAPDGRIYVVGGRFGMGPHTIAGTGVEAYDPKTNTWTNLPPLTTARSRPALAIGADLKIYAFGGEDANGNYVFTAETMDPLSGNYTWSPFALGGVPGGVGWRTAADFMGRIYAVTTQGRYRMSGSTFVPVTGAAPSPRFGLTGGQDGKIHLADATAKSWALMPPFLSVSATYPLAFLEPALDLEPAEGAIYGAGQDLQSLSPLAASVGTGKIRWSFDGNNTPVGCNPGAPLATNAFDFQGKRVGSAAATFNGLQAIQYPAGPCFNVGTGDFSIDFWVKPASLNSVKSVVDYRDGAGKGYHVALVGGQVTLQMSTGSGYQNFATTATVPLGKWSHVAITVKRSGVSRIWINAAAGATFPAVAGNLDGAGPFRLGGHKDWSWAGLNGTLDDVQLHPAALTWHQVRAIFLAGQIGKQ